MTRHKRLYELGPANTKRQDMKYLDSNDSPWARLKFSEPVMPLRLECSDGLAERWRQV